DAVRGILDFPDKGFQISWYAESNLQEKNDEARPANTPVVNRIAEAKQTQTDLLKTYPASRFANLFELDSARDKKDGNLRGPGNLAEDWLADAQAVCDAGFRYLAKSPRPEHVGQLRDKFGVDFVPRIVFKDVANNVEYRNDAISLAS